MTLHFDLAQILPDTAPGPACQDIGICQHCDVRATAICAILADDERAALNRLGRRVSISAGQTVMWEGDDATIVANVIQGTLKLSASTGDGREQIVGVVYPSDFIGRPFGRSTPHSVTALTDARLCLFTRGAFDGFARAHPELGHRLLQRTLDDLDRARGWMLLLGRKTAPEKIATFLLDMSRRLAGEDMTPLDSFALPLSRQQVADVLGLTIETVSRQMTDMNRAGIIALPNRRTVNILDRDRLAWTAETA
ncbi:MAG: Crp/Fnr family transcriptional regulator [bacterium]|nr:Crp/Fnr family transcriptional regulator [bacterium]